MLKNVSLSLCMLIFFSSANAKDIPENSEYAKLADFLSNEYDALAEEEYSEALNFGPNINAYESAREEAINQKKSNELIVTLKKRKQKCDKELELLEIYHAKLNENQALTELSIQEIQSGKKDEAEYRSLLTKRQQLLKDREKIMSKLVEIEQDKLDKKLTQY